MQIARQGYSLWTSSPYTLLQAGSTLDLSKFYLASPNVMVGDTLYTLSLGMSGTNLVLTAATNSGTAAAPGNAFWTGNTPARSI